MQHAGAVQVCDELGLPGQFFIAIELGDRCAHCTRGHALGPRVGAGWWILCGDHGATGSLRIMAAASSTADTILV